MKNKFLILSALTLVSACSMQQEPAPVETHSSKFYGRDQMDVSDDFIGTNNQQKPIPTGSQRHYSEYNTNQYSSGGTSSFLSGSDTVTSKKLEPAVAIDSDENVVNVTKKPTPNNLFQERANFGQTNISSTNTSAQVSEIKPVVKDSKTEYLDLAKVSTSNTVAPADDKLSKIHPVDKPDYQEPVEVAETPATKEAATETAKITPPKTVPTIVKAETASGAIKSDTNAEIAKTQAAEDYAKQEMAEIRKDVKKAPVEAVPSIKSDIAKIEAKAPEKKEESKKAEPVKEAKKEESEKEPAKEVAKEEAKPEPKKVEVADANAKAIEEIKVKEEPKVVTPKKFIKPVDGVVVSEFGAETAGKYNDGINIQAPEGTPVKAAAEGTVVYSGNQLQGYGNLVIIRHQDGYLTAYSHMQGLDLKKGDKVGQGDVIGRVGKSGNVDTPQLHFGVRKGREPVNPKDYL